MNCINFKNVSKIYHVNNKEFLALHDIDIDLDCAKHTIILGKSGSGKSTFLKLINQLITPDKGSIRYPSNFNQATVFQEARLLPWLTVEQNIRFWAEDSQSEKILKNMELWQFKDLFPHEISGGMAQKTALARAILANPNYLLLDEPFASLDYFSRQALQGQLQQILLNQNMGMLFITHNIDEAVFLADDILILEKGCVKHYLQNKVKGQLFSNESSEFKQYLLNII